MDLPSWLYPAEEIYNMLARQYAPLSIAAVMFAESAGVPFIAVLVFLTAGNMIASGEVSFVGAVLASTLGITLGSSFSYFLGYLGIKAGKKVTGIIFKREIKKVPYTETRAHRYLQRYGHFSIVAAQMVGTTRTFISFPAGAMEMNVLRFISYTTVGGLIFSFFYITGSLILNKFLRFLFQIISFLHSLSPWSWLLIAVAMFCGYLFYRRWGKHWIKAGRSRVQNSMQKFKEKFKKLKGKLKGKIFIFSWISFFWLFFI